MQILHFLKITRIGLIIRIFSIWELKCCKIFLTQSKCNKLSKILSEWRLQYLETDTQITTYRLQRVIYFQMCKFSPKTENACVESSLLNNQLILKLLKVIHMLTFQLREIKRITNIMYNSQYFLLLYAYLEMSATNVS
jgi:hypothetical protein